LAWHVLEDSYFKKKVLEVNKQTLRNICKNGKKIEIAATEVGKCSNMKYVLGHITLRNAIYFTPLVNHH
jgi:hypothetical protein